MIRGFRDKINRYYGLIDLSFKHDRIISDDMDHYMDMKLASLPITNIFNSFRPRG